jgi:DnaD/phage-associated family protein
MRPVSRLRAPYYINSSSSDEEFNISQEEDEEDFNPLINHRLNKLDRENGEEFYNLGTKNEILFLKNETGSLTKQRPGLKDETQSFTKVSPSFNNEMDRNESGAGSKTADLTSGGVFRRYEQNIGPLTPLLADEIGEALGTYPVKWIEDAIQIAVEYNKRSWAYCRVILERWHSQGKDDGRRKGRPGSPTREDEDLSPAARMLRELRKEEEEEWRNGWDATDNF